MLKQAQSTRHKTRPSSRVVYVIVAVMLVTAISGLLYVTDRLPFLRRTPQVYPTISTYTKGEPNSSQNTGGSRSPSGQDDKGNDTNSGPLLTPTGVFVSNHHPNMSDSPAGSDYITSVCSTSPEAKCQIVFINGSVIKSLPAETTDAGGAAYWNHWRLQDYGLTEGVWTIKAIATLNGQTKEATDALNLEVSQ